jgi:hypothetical protein
MRKRTIINTNRKELEEKEKTSITKKSRNQQGKFRLMGTKILSLVSI